MNQTTLSIIIPVYNAEDTLDACLSSLPEQPEILLIDDGSTDKSLALCQSYAASHKNVTVLTQQHKGQSAARNLGIAHANGAYLWFVDADDCILPDAAQHIADAMDGTQLLVFGYVQNGTNHSYPAGEMTAQQVKDTYFCAHADKRVKGSVWNKCFVRDILQTYDIIFPEDLSRNEEEVFLMAYIDHIEHIRFDTHICYAFHPITLQRAFVRIPDDYAQQAVKFKDISIHFAEKWDVLTTQNKNAIAKEFWGKMLLALKLCLAPDGRDRKRFYATADLLLTELPTDAPVKSIRLFRILRKKWYLLAYLLLCRQVK